jgi:predicted phage tail protein
MNISSQTLDRVVGAKGGQPKPYQPYKAPDSALSIATAKLLYFLSEGPIVGPVDGNRSVMLDGTPLLSPDGSENFPGSRWDFRPGTVDQEHIAGFPAVENEITQGFPVELKSDNAWTRGVNDPQLSAVRIRLSWPQIWEQRSNGDQVGYQIDYAIDMAVDGGSFLPYITATLNDKGTSEYERSHRIDLPVGFSSVLIRVRRLTPNRNDTNFADVMRIKGMTEVIDAKLRYPNLAVGALQFDASQFQNIPKFSVRARGRIIRVPSNYDPESRVYIGNWDGTFKQAYSNNPAWVWYDLVLHRRYGLGRRISADMVDRWTLYEIGRYCDVLVPDGKGGVEPRMTTNVYIQDQTEGYALLSDLASVFHGSSSWNGSMVTMVADIPGSEDGYVFTRSNVIGDFEYSAAAWPDRHTRAKVTWDNPANDFKSEQAAVTNDELIGILGHRQLDISAFGCTSEGQAMRHGTWALKSEQFESWSVSFATGMEGRNIEPGQIICVADELFSGRPNGGRIAAATNRVITLDMDAPVKPEDRLILNLPSGKAEGRIVKSVEGRKVTVIAAYSELPEAECSWSAESADLTVMRYRVQSIEPQGLHHYKITAVQHEPKKYDAIDHGARIEPQPITIIPPGVMAVPNDIAITSRHMVSQGIAITIMRISWAAVEGAVAYNVEWRKDSGNWIRLPRTGALGVDVENIYAGRYVVRVSAVNVMDVASIWGTSQEVQLAGKTTPPPVVSFLRSSSKIYGINLEWAFPPGAEDTQRTEIWQSPTSRREDAKKLADFAYPQARHSIEGLMAGARFFYWARLVDRTGNIGGWHPKGNGVDGQSSTDQTDYEEYFAGQISESALGQHLTDRIDLIDGPADLPGSVNGRLQSVSGAIQAISEKVEGVSAQVNPALAGDESESAGSTSLVGVWSEQSARIEDGIALGKRVEKVQVSVDETNAAVQEVSQAVVDLEGKASAMWSVRLQVNQKGQYVAAGIGLGIENTDVGLQSQFLVSADRFAVVNNINGGPATAPFVVQNGQTFISQALIGTGWITNAMIGEYIQSNDYQSGHRGWRLDKSGVLEFNGTVPGGGRLAINNRAVKVFDVNGVLRVQLGDLTA